MRQGSKPVRSGFPKKRHQECLFFSSCKELYFFCGPTHQIDPNEILIIKELPEVSRLRTQEEILQKVNTYKRKLAESIEEKEEYPSTSYPELDLIIFSLVDKIEALLWVLEIDLPESDILDRIEGLNH